MLNHNKKRNVGLLSEFFAKYIANALVQQKHSDIEKAKKVYLKYFSGDSEIAKELKYFNALYSTKLGSKEVAASLIGKVRTLCEADKVTFKKLEDEKTRLLHEISLVLNDKDFFNRPVSDYKIQGTIQVLLNSWRGPALLENISSLSSLEDSVVSHLISEETQGKTEESSRKYLEMTNEEIDSFVVGIMAEKFNSKFSKNLDEEQRTIISSYAFSEMPEKKKLLEEKLQEMKSNSLSLVEKVLAEKTIKEEKISDGLAKKLSEVKDLLLNRYSNVHNVTDDSLAFYMTLVKLQKELA